MPMSDCMVKSFLSGNLKEMINTRQIDLAVVLQKIKIPALERQTDPGRTAFLIAPCPAGGAS